MLVLLQILIAAIGITAGSYVDNSVSHAQVVQALNQASASHAQVYETQMLAPQRTDGSLIVCSSGILYRDAPTTDPKLIPWQSVTQWELASPQKADGVTNTSLDLKVSAMSKVAFKDDHYDFSIKGTPSDGSSLVQSLEHYDSAARAG